eukprot:GILJ01017240.1.p1 GENE.GILJ01017240.1~~GILJ01017240.1.p1  ORF type:complete len:1119 (-),score=139.66 GILJ01017240.1:2155-5169(-)
MDAGAILITLFRCYACWIHILNLPRATIRVVGKALEVVDKVLDGTVKALIFQQKRKWFLELFRKTKMVASRTGFWKLLDDDARMHSNFGMDWSLWHPLASFVKEFVTVCPQEARSIRPYLDILAHSSKTDTFLPLFMDVFMLATSCSQATLELTWHELPLVLRTDEINAKVPSRGTHKGNKTPLADVPIVQTQGAYESCEVYLDTYFRLLREDCFMPMREGISSFRACTLDDRDLHVFTQVKVAGVFFFPRGRGLAYGLTFQPRRAGLKRQQWLESSDLQYGNLLCLSPDISFSTMIWATVCAQKIDSYTKINTFSIFIQFCSDDNELSDADALALLLKSPHCIMVECPTFYLAYKPVLRALQSLDEQTLPFVEQLVMVANSPQPSYLVDATLDWSAVWPEAPRSRFKEIHPYLPRLTTTLDLSQREAVKHCLSSSISLVQGPPGTGKTFIGLKVVQLLLSCEPKLTGPILVLTYKNHVLDEFLTDALQFTTSIARLGGGVKEEELKQYTLDHIFSHDALPMRDSRQKNDYYGILSELQSLQGEVEHAAKRLTYNAALDVRVMLLGLPKEHVVAFLFDNMQSSKIQAMAKLLSFAKTESSQLQLVNALLSKLKQRQWSRTADAVDDDEEEEADDQTEKAHFPLKQIWGLVQDLFKKWLPASDVFAKLGAAARQKTKESNIPSLNITQKTDTEDISSFDKDEVEMDRLAAVGKHSQMKGNDAGKFMPFQRRNGRQDIEWMLTEDNDMDLSRLSCVSIWQLSPTMRVCLYQSLLKEQRKDYLDQYNDVVERHASLCQQLKDMDSLIRIEILKQRQIIVATTTGAAICQHLLQAVKPQVIMVEEAAEVLESQVLATLGPSVEHLIMIGDHQQLRPSTASYKLARDHHFDTSMFERLISNNLKHVTLANQSRMRPEMVPLLSSIYPNLQTNYAAVANNNAPTCIAESMFWWTYPPHIKESSSTSSRSKENETEATMAKNLACWLLWEGYSADKISILCMYQGHVRHAR